METEQARRWAIDALKADGQVAALVETNVFRPSQVTGSPTLYLTVAAVTDRPMAVLEGVVIYSSVLIQVTAWGRNQARQALETLMNRATLALHRKTGTTATATVFYTTRERFIPIEPTDEERTDGWDRLDAEFRATIQEAALA